MAGAMRLPQLKLTLGCGLSPTDPQSCDAPTSQGCQPFPSSGTRKAEAKATEDIGTRVLDTGKQVSTSSSQHKPRQLSGPGSPGQRKPMAFYGFHFGIWFSRHGGLGLMVGLYDLRGLFQPVILRFYWQWLKY